MPKKKHRTPQACIHLYNLPVPPAGYPSLPRSIAKTKNAKRTQSHPAVPPNYVEAKRRSRREFTRRRRAHGGQNEPNSSYRWRLAGFPTTQKMRNEPNPHVPLASRQLPHAQKSETNPISVETPNLHSTIYNIQSLGPIHPHGHPAPRQKNETNPISTGLKFQISDSPRSVVAYYAKRTQFIAPATTQTPK